MTTDSVQQRTMATPEPTAGLVGRTVEQLRQFICGLHGHDALLHFGPGRVSLQCTSCGYETPGWDVRTEPHGPATEGQPRMLRMPVARQRRAA
jgi:hypothetical protein